MTDDRQRLGEVRSEQARKLQRQIGQIHAMEEQAREDAERIAGLAAEVERLRNVAATPELSRWIEIDPAQREFVLSSILNHYANLRDNADVCRKNNLPARANRLMVAADAFATAAMLLGWVPPPPKQEKEKEGEP